MFGPSFGRRALCAAAILCASATASAQVKISQVYGAGGNTSAPLFSDYIEIYNSGAPQDLTGWSVQYASATGSFSAGSTTALPSIVLGTGQYLLVQQGTGGSIVTGQTPALPAPQATGTIAMSGTDAKVALVSSTTPLASGTPTYTGNPTLVDFIGCGTANWNDASASGVAHVAANNAPGMTTAHALYRRNCGGQDTNVSKDDWAVGFPAPRNTSTPLNGGLTAIGSALPLTVEELQSVRFTLTPYRCGTLDLGAGTTATIDLTAIGGGPTAMLDDGVAPDEVANDGIFTAVATVAAATTTGTKNLPVTLADGGGLSGGTYISIVVTPTTTPDNDNCTSAQAVAVPSSTSGTFTGAMVESNPFVTFAAAPTTGMTTRRGLWFSVLGTGNTMTASLCATLPALDTVMAVFAGPCDGMSVIATGDDNGPACTGSAASARWCSVAGATYYIWVSPFSAGASTAPFTFDVTDDGVACGTALPIPGCVGVSGPFSETEAGYGINNNDGCGSTPNLFTTIAAPGFPGTTLRGTARGMIGNRDIDAYRFQATVTDTITIRLNTLGTNAQAQLQQLTGAGGTCPTTSVGNTSLFLARCATGIQTLTAAVVAGNWYTINVVGGIAVQQGPTAGTVFGGQMPGGTTYQYELYVEIGAPPANDNCANAVTLATSPVTSNLTNATNDGTSSCDATGNDVWYAFTAGADAGTLNLNTCGSAAPDTVISVYDACGGTEIACNDDGTGTPCSGPASVLAVPLAANQSVRIRVSDKGLGGNFSLTWNFAVPPPANDECVGATVLPAGSTTAIADTRFATPVGANSAPASACQANQSRDVWFLWTSQGAGAVTVDTCGASQPASDSVITIYTGICGTLTEIACDDDTCPTPTLASSVTFTATCSTQYYIRVSQFGTSAIAAPWTLNITAPGFVDTDGDGTDDCLDGCPLDPAKIAPGICGCGTADTDTDGDGTADCNDGCPLDPTKIAPGICGCGIADTDTDGDGTADCNDGCPLDPTKIAPGICGCGIADTDTDGDGTADCNDGCPLDPTKIAPGICGCGVADTDTDGDGTADCNDGCPADPAKVAPGQCGCGVADTDTDGDGTADCVDNCPLDPLKVTPGQCGCGVADTDTDGDTVADCNDNCVAISNPLQEDCDNDTIGDVCELFNGTATDFNANLIPDNCEPGVAISYCTAGTSLAGCVPTLSASGVASAAAPSGYSITINNADGGRTAIFYYSITGPQNPPTPFGAGFLCISAPRQRMGNNPTGGTPGLCDGAPSRDFLLWVSTRPGTLGAPFAAGNTLNFQATVRDPGNAGNRVQTDAIQVTLLP